MPVFAQTCRKGPTEVKVDDPISNSIRQTRSFNSQFDNDFTIDTSTLNNAMNSAQQVRKLQTANAEKFLAATSGSEKHPYGGKNMSVLKKTTSNQNGAAVNGYVTDKGLFKPWSDQATMNESSGKYGCPITTQPQPLPTGFSYNATNPINDYVGSAFVKDPNTDAAGSKIPDVFLGSTKKTIGGKILPACGNEGVNVQVVYPSKATGAQYVGAYNIGTPSSTGYEEQTDMKDTVSYETCLKRAEDKGAPIFAYTGNKCYINPQTLWEARLAGLGVDLFPCPESALPTPSQSSNRSYQGNQRLLHFGKDGTLNILNTQYPSSNPGNIIYSIGQDTPLPDCDFSKGGVITKISGSWGMNCNSIQKTYRQNQHLVRWQAHWLGPFIRNSVVQSKGATSVYDVRV
jgi:hypothetical protein